MLLPLLGIAAAGAALGVAEALAVARSERRVPLPDLDPRLVGLRIAHLSDFHLGAPGPNGVAARRAVRLAMEARPDLIAITGDQLSHPRGEAALLELLAQLEAPLGVWAVLGNHDLGDSRDPLSRAGAVPDYAAAGVRLLRGESAIIEHDGVRVAISGVEAPHGGERIAPWPPVDADLQLVLAHHPEQVEAAPSGDPALVLAGHLHGGQICLPWPSGRVRLSQLSSPYVDGLVRRGAATLHVTRGVGTTFVPFRLLARPEVPILELVAEPSRLAGSA